MIIGGVICIVVGALLLSQAGKSSTGRGLGIVSAAIIITLGAILLAHGW